MQRLQKLTRRPLAGPVIFLALFACSKYPSKEKIVASYERAFNAHQIDSLLILFADSAQVEFAGIGPVLSGKAMLADKARYDSALDAHVSIVVKGMNRDTVFAAGTESNRWLRRSGLPSYDFSTIMFVISRGKITDLQAELSDSSVEAVNNVMQDLIPWAQRNEPGKLNQLLPDGIFSYSAKSANLSLQLLNDWQNRK